MRRLKRSTTLLQRSRNRFRPAEGRPTNAILREKIAQLFLFLAGVSAAVESGQLRLGKGRRDACLDSRSVLGEKLVLAGSVLDGQRNLGSFEARLAQPGGSMSASSCAMAPMLKAANAIATAAATFASIDSFIGIR